MKKVQDKSLVLFDGYCHLCSGTVKFILKHDRKKQFLFSPLEGEISQKICEQLQIPDSIDSVILIENQHYFIQSDAILRIANHLGGIFKLALVSKILPKSWRDQLYKWISHNRFNWFGRKDSCMMPTPEQKDRFL